jgi:hypothetical protein
MLASDLAEVHRIYAGLFAGLTAADWERPVKGGDHEWNLRLFLRLGSLFSVDATK